MENLKKNLNKATGILILDGKHVNILGDDCCIHVAYDTGIGVVDYWIDVTENRTAYGYIYRRLTDVGYKARCIVSDGHSGIVSLVEAENIPHQRCIFHLIQNLRDMLFINGRLKGGNKVLYSRLKYILKSKTIEELAEHFDWFRKHSRPYFTTKNQKSVLLWFQKVLPEATIYLSFEDGDVPHTSNLLENMNGQIEARLKTFRGVKSEKSLHNLLKILFRFRNYK